MQEIDGQALAAPAAIACMDRRERGDGGIESCDDVDDRDARLRRSVGRAGHAHQPADRLDERVVARECRALPLAEARDLAVDDAWVDGGDLLVAEPEALERARLEVRDHHVRALAQPTCELAVGGVAEVEDDRALVAIRGMVVGGAALRIRRRRPASRVVAVRRLDLDDVGAQVAERLRDERAREHPGQVDDAQAVQCGSHGR